MVSVNFKNSANKSAAEIAATTKPSVTIDIMSSPYQVIEASPEPIVDVYRLVFMNSNKGLFTSLTSSFSCFDHFFTPIDIFYLIRGDETAIDDSLAVTGTESKPMK